MWLELAAIVIILFYLFYRWTTKNNDFFKNRGLPYDEPVFFFGSMMDVFLRRKSFFHSILELYQSGNEKVYGIFEQRNPLLLIRDPELIKHITVKNFDHFINHRSIIDEDQASSDLFGSSLFQMKDTKWKDMRSTLSPAFTGSKMRHMFELINIVAENMSTYLGQQRSAQPYGMEMDLKELCTRFTNDVIASTAFGLQVDSYKDIGNRFYVMGKKVTTIKGLQALRLLLYSNLKFIVRLFKMKIFGEKTHDYFMSLVLDAMQHRKEHHIIRPDMINLLMEARGMIPSQNMKAPNREWTDVEIVAQCFLFFFAGFETSSVLMCFTAHELMENPDVQQKLYEEIIEVERELAGKPLPYETLQSMKYLDMIISETLRKYPPAIATDRLCNKDYEYVFDDGQRLNILKGDVVWLPIVGLQHDPKFFPNPDKFDPERFSDGNKDDIHPFTYMPFGMGPRNCIGSRFALIEAKALIYYIVRDFRIEAGKKTKLPLELDKKSFQMTAKDGFWLKLTSRSNDCSDT